MCVGCATAALKQFTDAGASALNKPTEVIGLVSLVTLASSVIWMLDPRNALHKVKGMHPGAGLRSRLRHGGQALWHLLLFMLPLKR
ncbi:MAG: hypothetical protein OXP68_04960 [Anaerolineaceae bacterium]|nr:hypothetical protein [Anaerolineaceae bacterium]MDE0608404.1 hypothetical protein [Anaerolineaceae bacterium]